MRIAVLLAALALSTSAAARADQYPVTGAWAYLGTAPYRADAGSCASYLKNPKAPTGHIVVFDGSKRTDFNGGYLEVDTVGNISVRGGLAEFAVTDRENPIDDEEGGGRKSKRHSYRLRILAPDRIELQTGRHPAQQFVRCTEAARPLTKSERTFNSPSTASPGIAGPSAARPAPEPAPIGVVESFFKHQIDENYWVYGSVYPGQADKPPACFLDNKYVDGSRFQLSIHPVTGQLDVWFRDHSWEIKGPHGANARHRLQLNVFDGKELVDGRPLEFVLWSKNHIKISKIQSAWFLKAFARGNKIVFVMPGTIINSTVEYKFAKATLNNLNLCIETFAKRNSPSQTTQPAAALPAGRNAAERTPALVEPDRPFATAGDWKISTAKFGVGCVATLIRNRERSISIGGETPEKLSLVVVADQNLFEGDLNADSGVGQVELVLGTSRTSGLRTYGYRGTPGVVATFDAALSRAIMEAPSLKLTEHGSVKLTVPLEQTGAMMAELSDCFVKTR